MGILEERGRVVIPKHLREQLGLKLGQEVNFEKAEDGVLIKPAVDKDTFSKELCGCVKKPKIRAQDVKNIWHL